MNFYICILIWRLSFVNMYLSLFVDKGNSKNGEVGCARIGRVGQAHVDLFASLAQTFCLFHKLGRSHAGYSVHQTRGRERASDGRFKSDTRCQFSNGTVAER